VAVPSVTPLAQTPERPAPAPSDVDEGVLRVFAPDPVAVAPIVAPEPVVAADPEPEPVVPQEPVAEPVAAEEPVVEPVAAEEPVAEPVMVHVTTFDGDLPEPTPTDVGRPAVTVAPEPDPMVAELEELRAHITHLEAALESALADAAGARALTDAEQRARRMLERADAACLELRQRAENDAARVREAATEASLQVLTAAERDARAMLERARRESETILTRARQAAPAPQPERPPLKALPDVDDLTDRWHETL
jgi:hypothetical protein